jgi:MoaA/NifB/PqqE/SkfB family radical SAM enzyme
LKKSPKEKSNDIIEQLSGQIKTPLSKETFCIFPFTQLSTFPTGEIKLCCRGHTISSIKNDTISSIWNGKKLQQIRSDLTNGKRVPECENCWKLEDQGVTSLREMINIERTPHQGSSVELWLNAKPVPITSFEFKLSNRCNLRCLICNPAASSRWTKIWPQLKKFYQTDYTEWIDQIINENKMQESPYLDLFMGNQNFLDDFKSLAPTVRIVDFAGGEPLIDPLHYETLKILVSSGQSHRTTLRYSTNLTVLAFEKFNVLELWDQFKAIEISISIDGYRELNEYIREGTLSHQLEKNIKTLKSVKKITIIKAATTLNAYNALFLAETIHYIVKDLNLIWFVGRVTDPSFLDPRVWPEDELHVSINKLKSLNLKQYKLNKSQEQRLQRLINETITWLNSNLDDRANLFTDFQKFTKVSDRLSNKSFDLFFK